ncbi:hypothetical protein CLIB1423_07S04236 [[Candida] railenensis]|uniref:RRM domain-containing protein n=1 Tax=[Candida] railenensis TaxID=45579 RepID=A0A9P0QPS1_9ASCO|nr:hypothetical protein CLIB1423_07S04236 [[Candida] railenensis]
MSLQEFFTDESFGGSWADDDIDIASISVPIEKHKHYSGYGDSFGSGGGDRHYGGGPSGGGYAHGDDGPPYIIKLVNLPISGDDSFVEDLFRSRYTQYVKFKIVVDPVSNILETKIIKKVAFVELHSFSDLQKTLKWTDLYYKDRRKVVVEKADFRDFQHCIQFNQQHEQDIREITEDFMNQKNQPYNHNHTNNGYGSPERLHSNVRVLQKGGPLNPYAQIHSQPPLGHAHHPHLSASELPPLQPPKPADPPKKFNPFGAARPVDVVAKQHEIEKKLIMVNHTTIKTIGEETATEPHHQKRSSVVKKSSVPEAVVPVAPVPKTSVDLAAPPPPVSDKPKYSPAPVPTSAYGADGKSGFSLAEMLSSKHTDNKSGRSSPAKNTTPKLVPSKPIILKKKIVAAVPTPEKETEILKEEIQIEPNSVNDVIIVTDDGSNVELVNSGAEHANKSQVVKSFVRAETIDKLTNVEPTSKTKEELASILQRNEAKKDTKHHGTSKYKNHESSGRRPSDSYPNSSHQHFSNQHYYNPHQNQNHNQQQPGQPFNSRSTYRRASDAGSVKSGGESEEVNDLEVNGIDGSRPQTIRGRGRGATRGIRGGRGRGRGRGGLGHEYSSREFVKEESKDPIHEVILKENQIDLKASDNEAMVPKSAEIKDDQKIPRERTKKEFKPKQRVLREAREPREPREPRAPRATKASKGPKELKEPKEAKGPREPREPTEAKAPQDFKESKEFKELKESKVTKKPKEFKAIEANEVSESKKSESTKEDDKSFSEGDTFSNRGGRGRGSIRGGFRGRGRAASRGGVKGRGRGGRGRGSPLENGSDSKAVPPANTISE